MWLVNGLSLSCCAITIIMIIVDMSDGRFKVTFGKVSNSEKLRKIGEAKALQS